MIHDRIEKIEAAVAAAPQLSAERRQELLALLAQLKAEIAPMEGAQLEGADSIARFTDVSLHEVTRTERKAALAEAALQGLAASVEGFEVSHPQLAQVVNRIAVTLSNMGI